MASLKEIRNRISSVNSTRQITSAMKMVSAAKFKRAQDAIIQMRPYAEKLTGILSHLSAGPDTIESVYTEKRAIKKVLLVSISSNRGLCGAFNSNVFKATRELADKTYANASVEVLPLGKKAGELMKKNGYLINKLAINPFDNLTYEETGAIANQLMEAYATGEYDKVVMVYNTLRNAAVQIIRKECFLPIGISEEATADYLFEPGRQQIMDQLIPQCLRTQLFKALLDSNASEHGARMTAMHKATDNATELSKELRLTYNKLRQASITNEILEIVGGAEALNS